MSNSLEQQMRATQAIALLALISSMSRPARPKAWYERGIVGDLTWPFR